MPTVIVSGSRNWPEPWFITAKLIEVFGDRDENPLIVTGGAKRRRDLPLTMCSVDEHAHLEAVRLGWPTDVMPADWSPNGVFDRGAGHKRNIAMLEKYPDAVVMAFQYQNSPGTGHMIREAYKRGHQLHRFTERDVRPDIASLDMGDIE